MLRIFHIYFSLGADPKKCFSQYVDAILDLVIPGHSPGIKEAIVDLHQKEELVSNEIDFLLFYVLINNILL